MLNYHTVLYQPLQKLDYKEFKQKADNIMKTENVKSKEDLVILMRVQTRLSLPFIRISLNKYEKEIKSKLGVLS